MVVGIIILIILVIIYIFSLYLYRVTIDNRKTNFKAIGSEIYDSVVNHSKIQEDALLNNSQEVYVKTNGLKLHAYDWNNQHHDYVILVHGYRGHGIELCRAAGIFEKMGFNVLVPDLRGHGKSEGNYIGMGYDDHFDILSWMKYIKNKYPQAKVVLYGISMGAATVLMSAGENSSNLVATIEDSGYKSIMSELKYQFKNIFHLPTFPLLYTTNLITFFKNNYTFNEGNTLEFVKKIKKPVLFIHGNSDKYVPIQNAKDLYEACSSPKELLIVPGAKHVAAEYVDSKKYWQTIKNFLKKYIDF